MPDYKEWTVALYYALIENTPAEEGVYLQISSESLEEIGQANWPQHEVDQSWNQHFIDEIKRFLMPDQRMNLRVLQDRYIRPATATERAQGLNYVNIQAAHLQQAKKEPTPVICPLSLGFLVFEVLVAESMQSDADHSATNYYHRMSQLLGLQDDKPPGLDGKTIGQLWVQFNQWLDSRGWLATAQEGIGPHRFTRLPISQCLLRQADKQILHRLFHDKHDPKQTWPPEKLVHWLREQAQGLNQHLKTKLSPPLTQIDPAFIQDIYAFYLDKAWVFSPQQSYQRQILSLKAGLYRQENPFTGQIDYFMHPEMRRQYYDTQSAIYLEGQQQPLQYERPGFYRYVDQSLSNPAQNKAVKIFQHPRLKALVFVGSPCWALVADPLTQNAGDYASWHKPKAGESFILLCLAKFESALNQLKTDAMVTWQTRYESDLDPYNSYDWHEYHGFQLLEIDPVKWITSKLPPELAYLLIPNQSLGLSISGGLQLSGTREWLYAFPLMLEVLAQPGLHDVKLYRLDSESEKPCFEATRPAREAFEIKLPQPGTYRLDVQGPAGHLQRQLEAKDWSDLEMRMDSYPHYDYELDEIACFKMEGGHIFEDVTHR